MRRYVSDKTLVRIIMVILSTGIIISAVLFMMPFTSNTNYSATRPPCTVDTTNIHIMRYVQWYRRHGDIDTLRRDFYYPSLKAYLIKHGFDECEATVYAELPSVESNWRNDLVSSSGAIGIWQVMPNLGKAFNKTPIELKDPATATYVAVEYLKKLRITFNKDISKVLFAYNTGPGELQRVLNDYKTVDIWKCTFKSREAQEFAPKVLAAAYYMNYDTDRK